MDSVGANNGVLYVSYSLMKNSLILAELAEQQSDDIARLITEDVREKLRVGGKWRVLEGDRLRLGVRVRLKDDSPIALLAPPCRLIGALRCAGVDALGDLNRVSEEDPYRGRNIGRSSLLQLRRSLAAAGRSLQPAAPTAARRM